MASDTARRVSRVFDAVERRDLEALTTLYAPDVEIHEARSLPHGGTYVGLEGARTHAAAFVSTWDRFQQAEQRQLQPQVLGTGDMLAAVWRHRASSSAGQEIDLPAISLFQMRDGLVRRLQMFHFDVAALLRFLDVAGGRS